MEEKLICCCGASGWTRVIGWFEIVGSIISTFFLTIILLVSAVARDQIERSEEKSVIPEGIVKTFLSALFLNTLTNAAWFSAVQLILSFLSIIMAIVLLIGSYNRNARLIQHWIVYQVIYSITWAFSKIFQIYVEESIEGVTLFTRVIWVFALGIQVFCLLVVLTHKQEIKISARHIFPVKV